MSLVGAQAVIEAIRLYTQYSSATSTGGRRRALQKVGSPFSTVLMVGCAGVFSGTMATQT
jgi:hypothetical protein